MKEESRLCQLHTMVNRSDSEKLGDVKLHFKSEVHIEKASENMYRSRTKSFEHRSEQEMEMDFPKLPFWFNQREANRRRHQLLASKDSEIKLLSSRRESSGSNEERKERMLEILREIVRKCSVAEPAKRPTAKELLRFLTMKSSILREK